jgi:energy-coupling factor transporter transmembrane protein EcfT
VGAQVWSLISLGVGLNLVLGALVAAFRLPIYLDSLGTVLVAALAGPGPAVLTGACGVALLGLTNPVAIAFIPVAALVGCLAGVAARCKGGCFRRGWTATLVGALVGCLAALVSAPIAAVLFGGVTGGGTDLMVALFRAGGLSTLQAALGQSLAVDPLDKAVTFGLVYSLLQALPGRTRGAFPLAEKLAGDGSQSTSHHPYRAQQVPLPGRIRERPSTTATGLPPRLRFPQAATEWKLLAALSLVLLAGLGDSPERLSLALLIFLAAYLLAAPRVTGQIARRLLPALLPLVVSLVLIHGLVARSPEEVRTVWLGLSWSLQGLRDAWLFSLRLALILLSLSMFLSTTPLQRLAELLLRWRVPYPLVFVMLTGVNLATSLQQRWRLVEQAQQARGLWLRPSGWRARVRVLMGLLAPTLGALFDELPQRSACLQSRGLLRARPRWAIPASWTGEPAPTRLGLLFYLALIALAWGGLLWR